MSRECSPHVHEKEALDVKGLEINNLLIIETHDPRGRVFHTLTHQLCEAALTCV